MNQPYPFADLDLARRLERTEARANAAFVDSRARLQPDSGACWIAVAGAYAMFDGVDSPLTQTFGLGVFESISDAHLDELEAFFTERGSDTFHEVSPLAGPELLARLAERGYRPIEVSNVLYRPTEHAASTPTALVVRQTGPDEADRWARTSAEGWRTEAPELVDFMLALGQISAQARGIACFVAEQAGEPIAAGALSLGEGVALMAGASTLPPFRGQGAQRALFEARMAFALRQGYPLAMVVTMPGSASQRNAERQGFRIAYTRTKWHRPAR